MKHFIIKFFFPLAFLVLFIFVGVAGYQYIKERRTIVTRPDIDLSAEERQTLEEQVRKAEEAIAQDEENFSAYVERALAFERLGEWKKAVRAYEDMNKQFEKNFLSYSNLGNLYLKMKDFRNAERMYTRAIQNANTKPDLVQPLLELYRYHLPEKQKEIPRVIEESLRYNPEDVGLLASLATYYDELGGDKQKAMETWERLLRKDPKHEIAQRELDRLRE